jgi:hypothetical protein
VNVYSYLHQINVCIVCSVVATVMTPRRARANPSTNNVALDSPAVLAVLQEMQQELATLRHDIPVAHVGSTSIAATQSATIGAIPADGIPTGVVPGDAAKVAPLVSGISLM